MPFHERVTGSVDSLADLGTLGDFELIREIGRGGMGVVYEAEQISLGRRVALKVLPFAAFLDGRRLDRFQLEAHAAAALKHDNIVTVYCVGSERGVHYYAMELVRGQSLSQVLAELRSSAWGTDSQLDVADTLPIAALSTEHSGSRTQYMASVARLMEQIARAMYYAHELDERTDPIRQALAC